MEERRALAGFSACDSKAFYLFGTVHFKQLDLQLFSHWKNSLIKTFNSFCLVVPQWLLVGF